MLETYILSFLEVGQNFPVVFQDTVDTLDAKGNSYNERSSWHLVEDGLWLTIKCGFQQVTKLKLENRQPVCMNLDEPSGPKEMLTIRSQKLQIAPWENIHFPWFESFSMNHINFQVMSESWVED